MSELAPNMAQVEALEPVVGTERIFSVDILRGFALCGILVINITSFALPAAAMFSPIVAGGMEGLNGLTWQVGYVVFFQKMMAIFSMLFGAGLILMGERAEASGQKFKGIYYRRLLWLAVIGTIHGYFIWYGDILFAYAVCGVFMYPLRKLRPLRLIVIGIVVLIIGAGMMFASGVMFDFMQSSHVKLNQADVQGTDLGPGEAQMAAAWPEVRAEFYPSQEKLDEEIAVRRGSYWKMTKYFVMKFVGMQTQTVLFYYFWRGLGVMLIGMGLMKMGVFSARKSKRFYLWLMIIGYAVGLPVTVYATELFKLSNFDIVHYFKVQPITDYFSSILVALGHVGLLMLIIKSDALGWLTSRLAAVGQMAFTNYLMHSVLMGLAFFGVGCGLFAKIDRFNLIWFVIGTWILQLIISPIWLKYYRFGPAEWLWRSLTYFKKQPMRT